jgi:hypothetical protein
MNSSASAYFARLFVSVFISFQRLAISDWLLADSVQP